MQPIASVDPVPIGAEAKRLAALREIVTAGAAGSPGLRPTLTFGLDDVDRNLPGAGLAAGALHETYPATHADSPAALGFAVALTALALGVRRGPAMLVATRRWLGDFGTPFGHGLRQLGLDVGRLHLVETRSDKDALWAMEEALRSKAVATVLGTVDGEIDLTRSRRLSLAAASSGTPLVLLRTPRTSGASAAVTRWRVGTGPAARDRFGTSIDPRWKVVLERCRNGRTGQWLLEWDHVAHRFRMAEGLAHRPLLAGARQRGLRLAG